MDPDEEALTSTDDVDKLKSYLVSIQGKITDLEKSKTLKRKVSRHNSSMLCKLEEYSGVMKGGMKLGSFSTGLVQMICISLSLFAPLFAPQIWMFFSLQF